MSSSPLLTEEAQASTLSATTPSQPAESPIGGPVTNSPTMAPASSSLFSSVGDSPRDSATPCLSISNAGGGSLTAAVGPASPAPNPPTPRAPHGSANEQDSAHAKLVSSAGYVVPAPSFSIFPRMNAPAGTPQQSHVAPALKLNPPIPAAALQPPVPVLPFGNKPSFSYNVVPHAHPSSASGQQFRPTIATNPVQLHSVRLMPPTTASSLQPPAPGQPLRPNSIVPGMVTQNIPQQMPFPIPKGQVSTSSNFSYGGSAQSTTTDAAERQLAPPKDGISNVTTSETGIPSVVSVNPQSVTTSANMASTSSANSTTQNSSSLVVETSLSLAPSLSMPPPQNVPQQIYSPYPSLPTMAAPSHAPWLHPPFPGGLQHSPYLPYPAAHPLPFPLPMQGHSLPVVPSPNVPPPGVSTAVPGEVLTNPESDSAKKLSAGSLPPTTGDEKQVNDFNNYGGTTKSADEDVWTAHKTETGVVYYYNSVTGESTYDKPSSFKGEEEKISDQPSPVTWEKFEGTSWTLITTNDGKKYYYDTKNKVSSWQIPAEIVVMKKNQESDSLKGNTAEEENAGVVVEKVSASVSISTPAVHTGGRDSIVLRPLGGQVTSSALDLIKKKLQDAGAPATTTALSPSTIPPTSELNAPKAVEAEAKGLQSLNSKEKGKDANGDNVSDSSSDSDDAESGPTKEECVIQFKEMLKERGVAPFSKWDKELPKIVFDPRFKAVPSYSTRRSLFEHFVRTRAEEERKEKRAAQKAAIDGFKHLLEEASEEIDHKTDYQSFKRKWGKDPRFEALDRKERELLLNEKVLHLKKAAEEQNQAIHSAAVSSFKSMLRENNDITISSRWSKVKDSLRNDPRYKIVKHEEREILFNEYIGELKAADNEAEQAAKAKRDEHDKLKEREREMRKRKEREEQEMERIRLKVRRKEAISSYQALLVETIKDPKASWTESKPKLAKDPQGRATNPDLSEADMEKLFRDHVKDLFERCARDYRYLLSEVITAEAASQATDDGKNVLNSWSEAKRLLKPDPRYSKMPRKERESLWSRHADDLIRKRKTAGDSKKRPNREGRDITSSADYPRKSPRRSHGRM